MSKSQETIEVYYADCDQFDNHRTGYYATEEAAESAFWSENNFSDNEQKQVRVYTRGERLSADTFASAISLAKGGSPSPALGIDSCTSYTNVLVSLKTEIDEDRE